jgi:hypothetical protein
MIRIDTKTTAKANGKRFFVDYPLFKEEETYNKLVAEWKDKNTRGLSVALDASYHPEKNITINCDEIEQIIRK